MWTNGITGWHIQDATPGLYTLDIEHIPDGLVDSHNAESEDSISSRYRRDLCIHKCPSCFNEQGMVYSQEIRDLDGKLIEDDRGGRSLNRMLSLEETLSVVDQAMDIAQTEGHDFRSVKFLGPGELLMNPQLFEIIEAYQERGIIFNIFTKGALLGSDELAQRYHGMSAKELTDKLASYDHVGLLMSFQSFDGEKQEGLVSTRNPDGSVDGLEGYAGIREQALEHLFGSQFYQDGMTNRLCILNAPMVPENIDESFDIYKFFVERGTPVVMTPSMISGKGCGHYERQDESLSREAWHDKLVELYANIYLFNLEKGIQTDEQIRGEGIASYVGAEPCNQVATGLYLRANGLVQMCPGRFDKETVYANVRETPLREIWQNSPNRQMGIDDPQNLVNNRCPAKDENGSTVKVENAGFPEDFYERVMGRYDELRDPARSEAFDKFGKIVEEIDEIFDFGKEKDNS